MRKKERAIAIIYHEGEYKLDSPFHTISRVSVKHAPVALAFTSPLHFTHNNHSRHTPSPVTAPWAHALQLGRYCLFAPCHGQLHRRRLQLHGACRHATTTALATRELGPFPKPFRSAAAQTPTHHRLQCPLNTGKLTLFASPTRPFAGPSRGRRRARPMSVSRPSQRSR